MGRLLGYYADRSKEDAVHLYSKSIFLFLFFSDWVTVPHLPGWREVILTTSQKVDLVVL